MSIGISKRLEGMVQSDIRRMTRECNRVGGINLGQGLCDLPTPPVVKDAAIRAIQEDLSLYSVPEGVAPLREAIAKKLESQNRIVADPTTEIVVTAGSAAGFVATLTGLLNPGDGLVLFEPFYGYHLNSARVCGMDASFCQLDADRDFAFSRKKLEAALKPNTRAVVVCTPANPSGKMWTREELESLAEVVVERDLLVITDEIYEFYRFDGRPHVSPASIPSLRDRTVTLMGLSKTFNITGWRLGYAVAPAPLAQAILLVGDLFNICAPTPLQHGVTAGFGIGEAQFESMRRDYTTKREKICQALASASMEPKVPQGAYYVLADCSGAKDSRLAAETLLERAGVAAIPGRAFYSESAQDRDRFLRFCFAVEEPLLDQACDQIAAFSGWG